MCKSESTPYKDLPLSTRLTGVLEIAVYQRKRERERERDEGRDNDKHSGISEESVN